ncbi:SET domain-containing protein SmydA-8 [Drosophila ficusphila]|uniref:SET domain-containing protein SmydA-8 n=1 Tax=Drosophila ficusphila TaxID=30025 RepID=UPI001C89C3E4|nr:SET domain-containing protein SmydA-8 [Drosophila ficusphila]
MASSSSWASESGDFGEGSALFGCRAFGAPPGDGKGNKIKSNLNTNKSDAGKKKNHHKNSNRTRHPKGGQQTKDKQDKQEKEQELEKDTPPEEQNAPFRIAHSEVFGRYLEASRPLEAGEMLIREEPLAIGPCVSGDPVCLGCYRPVSLDKVQYRCPRCAWPLCDASCAGIKHRHGHTEAECQLYADRRAVAGELLTERAGPAEVRDLYELVMIVRILLLRQHDPEQFALIARMESHTEERRQNEALWQHYEKKVVQRLRVTWQLEDLAEEQVHEVCGILDVNCFEIGQNGAKARTLYPSAFLLAHDCTPNTAHTDDPVTFEILLRTSRRVREREALTLSYAYTLQGTLKRRAFMHEGKLFWCRCHRCSDPFELGTDCSAFVCAKCRTGSVRAKDPLEQTGDWACDRCSHRIGAKDLERQLDRINDDLEAIDVHDIPGLENFLLRYRDVLRPNHYLLLSAKYSLCQIYGRIEGYLLPQMSPEDIARKESYCREFLEIVDVLDPGLTRLRGLIMYELHAPVMVLAQSAIQSGQISRQEFQRRLKEVVKLLQVSRDILCLEPQGSTEHEMGLAAADALSKMGC